MIIFNKTNLPGVVTFSNNSYSDERGFFMETYNREVSNFFDCNFVQDNLVKSINKNIIRGLHFQREKMQAKLVRVIEGEIFDVAVDIRIESPTYKQWVGKILSDTNHINMFIPEGFAHGYCTLSEITKVTYKCSNYYEEKFESGIIWNDPNLNINWPTKNPILSDKDKSLLTLKKVLCIK